MAPKGYIPFRQFNTKGFLIQTFKITRTKLSVYFNRCSNYLARQFIEMLVRFNF